MASAGPQSWDYLGAIDALIIRRDTLESTIGELVPDSPWADTVARLRCLRGIDTLSAVGLCAEIGDWARFPRPAHLMSYLGLVGVPLTKLSPRAMWLGRRDSRLVRAGRPPFVKAICGDLSRFSRPRDERSVVSLRRRALS